MPALGEGLSQYYKQGFRSFHTPGHKGRQEFFVGVDFPGFDLTELPGLDMLHAPEGIIQEAQKRAAEIFGAEESFFLVNGATVGNQAMFMSLEPGSGRVLVERQSHRSVMAALILTGLQPVYIPSVIHPDFNLPLGIDLENISILWDDINACHLTYPSYYGTTVDLDRVIKVRNSEQCSKPILIDQAHGAHYLGTLFPSSALALGADLVLHSTHKTLSALTQAAMLHVQGHRVSRSRLRQSLELLQSSSPSYLLMLSLERAAESAWQLERWEALHAEVKSLHHKVGTRLRLLNEQDAGSFGIKDVDWSKILVNTSSLGVPAFQCVEYLRNHYQIEPELWDDENILFILGIGNTAEDVKILSHALYEFPDRVKNLGTKNRTMPVEKQSKLMRTGLPATINIFPPQRMSPREAFLASKKQVPLRESLGCIMGENISPYPPGVPLVVMGEEMTPEILEFLLEQSPVRWQGWDGFRDRMVWIIEEG